MQTTRLLRRTQKSVLSQVWSRRTRQAPARVTFQQTRPFSLGVKTFSATPKVDRTINSTNIQSSNTDPNSKPLFDKILIANRGEIACRVIRTARKLGIKTVAVYSEADAKSMHVSLADEAYLIGPPESKRSYLLGDKILEVAKRSGAQAIHPGYGFLSENAGFARKCEQNGIVFIGPPASAIVAMGSKSESKKIMIDANVPVVPGYHGEEQSKEKLKQEADRIGYPVLIKAVMGGGGKGMRIVKSAEEFDEQLQSAQRESKNSFGDDTVLVERYIGKPRHVEIQVFADTHGNCVYLFERDCSVQRRHQKIIEEAPAPGLSQEVRRNMGESAVAAARAVGYVGAGTVEFIMDNEDHSYYFMEMNTRLQVEHPVTEMITGQDLVEWQVRVASGHTLPLSQSELAPRGHSFETRIYAENPDNNFLPGTGTLQYLKAPEEIPGQVRVETGVRQGDEVSIYYDPMIAKLVVWAEDRDKALKRLRANLEQYHIAGLVTNIEFLKRLCTNKHFRELDLDTHFIQRHFDELFPKNGGKTDDVVELGNVLGAVGLIARTTVGTRSGEPFASLKGTRLNHNLVETIVLKDGEEGKITVDLTFTSAERGDKFQVKTSTQPDRVREVLVVPVPKQPNVFTIFVDDEKHQVTFVSNDKDVKDHKLHLFTQRGDTFSVEPVVPAVGHVAESGTGSLKSPMPGAIMAVNVKPGDTVKKGQTLLVMESMKMELKIASPSDGVVQSVTCREGDSVGGGQVLAIVVPENK